MKSLIFNDIKYRKNFCNFEINFLIMNSIKKNKLILNFQKWNLLKNIDFKKNSKVKLKNRCILTGRSSSISRIYRFSRIKFLELGREGYITGLKKSSW